jgi:hypothetical protein
MNDTLRGLIVFIAVLITIALWVPLSNHAEPRLGGGSNNDIYFGLFHYLVVHSEMNEPNFHITKALAPGRLAATATSSAALWIAIVYFLKATKPSAANRRDPK